MTICRYFLQGTCRYGNRCRYEHVYPNQHSYGANYGGGSYGNYRGSGGGGNYTNSYGYNGSYGQSTGGNHNSGQTERGGMSILRAKASGGQFQQGATFGQSSANSPATNQLAQNQGFFNATVAHQKPLNPQESKELLQMVINEFTIWEHSGMWPLSCFSLFRGQSCFPGLIDYSPEEIRWFMYQGRLVGNFEECQQFVKELLHKSKLVKEQFMIPNAHVLDVLSRLLRGEKMEVSPPSPLFPPIKLNAVGNSFGSTSGGNLTSATSGVGNVFGSGGNQTSATSGVGNVFGSGGNQTSATSGVGNVFGSGGNQTSATSGVGNVFGSGGNQTSATSAATPFAPATSAVSSFTFTLPSNVQENTDQTMGRFGASQMSMFPNPMSVTNSSNTSQSVFGGASQSISGSEMTSSLSNDYVIYSPMSELSEETINAFNYPVYAMGSVPTKPPPKELCILKR